MFVCENLMDEENDHDVFAANHACPPKIILLTKIFCRLNDRRIIYIRILYHYFFTKIQFYSVTKRFSVTDRDETFFNNG